LLGATLTGLLFYIYQNRLVSDKKNSGQFPNPTKTSISNSPAQPNRCINNSPQAQNSRPITIQKPELVKADDFFKEATSLHENYQYDEALDYFKMALKLYEQDKKFEQQAVTLGRIGTVYYHKANYKTAIDYHEKRLNIVRGIRRRAID
jgi:tetratricopeptide (TPR) repeat protein